ncbi:response regulator [Pelagibacterium montanilacus]|uniref:response regulator n=1 Tax=Pelagibacterium montanilacus TaxID=2185280 RepID=UPI000F8EC362|nr:response regulator [Pelagibacterium montanilacus]
MTGDPTAGAPVRSTVLCVEDEAQLRRDMVEELQEAGYTAIEAANGTEALAQIDAIRPDLILCDINMPGTNGYEVLRTLRDRHPEYADIPFIFLTALADPREIVEGKRSGADDYLIKPVDFDLMLATVQARLRQIERIRIQRDAELDRLRATLSGTQPDPGAGIEQVLDLVATGIVLLDRRGHVRHANCGAREVGTGTLEIKTGAPLRALEPAQRDHLKDLLARVIADSPQSGDHVLSCALARAPDQRDLLVVACPIPAQSTAPHDAPVAALFITDPDRRPRPSASVLAPLFGLTRTEAEIALELADGHKPAAIAAALGIAQTTVAFHMRNLFQKTGTGRQAELVALILAGPLTLARPDPQM